MNNDIRLSFLDLDKTLLDNNHQVGEETINAMKMAKEQKKVHSVIVTGRPLGFGKKISNQAGISDFVISNNGCLIHNIQTNENLFKSSISDESALQLFDLYKELNALFFMAHTRDLSLRVDPKRVGNESPENLVFYTNDFVKDVKTNPNTVMTCIIGAQNDEQGHSQIAQARAIIEKINGIQASHLCYNSKNLPYIDIFPDNCSKETAILHLIKHLGLDISQTMGIGDGGNDIPMLNCVGVPVAMANATDKVKQFVLGRNGYVTERDNNNNGVADAYYKYIFNK